MIEFYNNHCFTEVANNEPDYKLILREELADLDKRLVTLKEHVRPDSTIKLNMTVHDAALIRKQYDAMVEYYSALMERCIRIGVIYTMHSPVECLIEDDK